MRVKHWIKNILIVLPAFFGKVLTDPATLADLFVGFLVFSLCSSAIYIINDMSDIENDRRHPVKCKRPLASGDVSKTEAVILLIILLAAAAVMDLFLCGTGIRSLIPVLYLVINLMYSLSLKNKPVIDIVLLVSGFFLRVLYGSAVTGMSMKKRTSLFRGVNMNIFTDRRLQHEKAMRSVLLPTAITGRSLCSRVHKGGKMIRYKIKNTAYVLDEETGDTLVLGENETVILHTNNPIVGFNTFWGAAGFEILKEIRDKIKPHGFNRWTGEKES